MIVDHQLPHWAVRGQSNRLSVTLYSETDARTIQVPTSGTLKIYAPGSTTSSTATVDASVTAGSSSTVSAYYDWTPGATLNFGEGYTEQWTLTFTGGVEVVQLDAAVVRSPFRSVVTEDGLKRVYPQIVSTFQNVDYANFGDVIKEAANILAHDVRKNALFPFLIMSPDSYRQAQTYKVLELLFVAAGMTSKQSDSGYLEKADVYHKLYDTELANMRCSYDSGGDGLVDTKGLYSTLTGWVPNYVTGYVTSSDNATMRGPGTAYRSVRWDRR